MIQKIFNWFWYKWHRTRTPQPTVDEVLIKTIDMHTEKIAENVRKNNAVLDEMKKRYKDD